MTRDKRALFIPQATTDAYENARDVTTGDAGSTLARRQAALVKEALEEHRYEVELVTVETTGDDIQDELIHRLGKTGAFVRELDERVLEGISTARSTR